MSAVLSPNLPKRAEAVILGESYADLLLPPLKEQGIRALLLPPNPDIDPRLSCHADLSVLHARGNRLILAPYLQGTQFAAELEGEGMELIFAPIRQQPEYPGDSQMNLCIIGSHLIGRESVETDRILNYFTSIGDRNRITVRQGYTRCSVCIADEASLITADRGIARSACAAGLDVLLISPGHIRLDGYDYGFIGGCSFRISEHEICFTGNLDEHPDADRIFDFLKRRRILPVFLTDSPAFDIGSAVPFKEK